MNATAHFPWAEVASNAVWICGLAVILAALGWHDYKRRELKERNLKVAATTRAADEPPDGAAGFSLRLEGPETPSDVAAGFSLREDKRNLKITVNPQDMPSPKPTATTNAEPLMKPVLLGLIMVTGGAALSVRGTFLAAAFATAGFALIFIFAKKMLRRA